MGAQQDGDVLQRHADRRIPDINPGKIVAKINPPENSGGEFLHFGLIIMGALTTDKLGARTRTDNVRLADLPDLCPQWDGDIL